MNPVLGIIGNLIGGNGSIGNTNTVGNAQANSVKNKIGNIIGLYNMLKGKSDYMQTLQSMAPTNPQIKKAFDVIQENGGDMQSTFYKLAEQNGIDPNQVINMLK